MMIFAVDHEPTMLRDSERAIRKSAPDAEILCFELAADALAAIHDRGLSPDIVFTAIEMPGISGLEFAVALRTVSPDTRIVFVTALSHYALDAFKVHAQGYLIKPLTPEQVRAELEVLPSAPQTEKLRVQCFGCFEVFWRGEPLMFSRRHTKELFAYLVNRRGATCTTEDVISALWGEISDLKNAKHRVRNYIGDLRETLKAIGMEDPVPEAVKGLRQGDLFRHTAVPLRPHLPHRAWLWQRPVCRSSQVIQSAEAFLTAMYALLTIKTVLVCRIPHVRDSGRGFLICNYSVLTYKQGFV